jgi:hypothetical protein
MNMSKRENHKAVPVYYAVDSSDIVGFYRYEKQRERESWDEIKSRFDEACKYIWARLETGIPASTDEMFWRIAEENAPIAALLMETVKKIKSERNDVNDPARIS